MLAKLVTFAALVAAATAAPTCDLGTEITKLTALVSNENLKACSAASGFKMIPPDGMPTAAQMKVMCVNNDCKAMISAIKAINPTDCILDLGTVKLNVHELAFNFDNDCKQYITTTTATTTTATTTTATTSTTATTGQNPSQSNATTATTTSSVKPQC